MDFRIGEIEDYGEPFTKFELPVQIGHFSTDSDNKFCDDDHQLKYLSMPDNLENLNLDLNEGFSKFIGVYNDEEHSYNKLLRWIICHKEVKNLIAQEDTSKGGIDFICRRGVLTTINSTIYDGKSDWSIYATKFRSVIYLCKMETEKRVQEEASRTERERRMMSYGYKFAQYVTSDSINAETNPSHPVNVNEKYYVVMKGKFGNHGMLFSGETDAIDPQSSAHEGTDSKSMNRFVEIKTNYILRTENMEKAFRRKMHMWYLQCFIAGIPRVICGFRNMTGIVREIKVYNVSDLPRMAQGLWSPDVSLNFGSRFLSYVKECVVKDDPNPKIDFVLFRGLLTHISSTLYEKNEDWLIHATKFNSVIYLCDIRTDRKIEFEEQATEKQKRMTTWGFKFEQYMVSDTMSSEPDTSAPVNENEKYFAVFKGKLGHHRLLFCAEMDGVHPDPTPPKRYVELKTSRIITGERQERNFRRFKLLKWHLQSYFAGVPEVICGFRNDEGIVRKLKTFTVSDMPRQADGLWSSAACLNFTSHFLDHVKKCVIKEEAVYEFYWRPGSDTITCEELDSDYAFLPEWYTSRVRVI